ncbi:MAG TPA: alpha/beta fold hydrolase [bacterium]|nr:alpha/beta fold hydrolase [bacterium]
MLLVHGICASTRYWTERLGPLEKRFRCIVPDLLGHGRSPKPSRGAYDLAEQTDAVEAVIAPIAAQAEQPIPIICHSMGNLISLELRRRHPSWFGPILGLSIPAFPSPEVGAEVIGKLNPFAKWAVDQPWYAGPLLHASRVSRGKLGYGWFHKTYRLPRDCWEDGFCLTWPAITRTLKNLIFTTDVHALLQAAGTDRLAWWHGTHDQSAPFELAKRLAAMFPEIPFAAIDKGDHNIWIHHNAYFTGEFSMRLGRYYGLPAA